MNKVINGTGFVFYPDSCPLDNVLEYILPKYPIAISPLHNRDKNSEGKLKKAHYHVLCLGKLSVKDKNYISKITTQNYFEPIYDTELYYQYLWHYKNGWYIPKKAQYWFADVILSDSFDVDKLKSCTDSSNTDLFNDMIHYIQGFLEIADLLDAICIDDSIDPNLKEYIIKHISICKDYINSTRYHYYQKVQSDLRAKLDDEFFEDSTLITDMQNRQCDLFSYRNEKNVDK